MAVLPRGFLLCSSVCVHERGLGGTTQELDGNAKPGPRALGVGLCFDKLLGSCAPEAGGAEGQGPQGSFSVLQDGGKQEGM